MGNIQLKVYMQRKKSQNPIANFKKCNIPNISNIHAEAHDSFSTDTSFASLNLLPVKI